jgi:hypothetical protein
MKHRHAIPANYPSESCHYRLPSQRATSAWQIHGANCADPSIEKGSGFLVMTMENAVRFILGRPVSWY